MKTLYFSIFYLLLACSGTALAQEIPNGDGDLLWEKPLNGRTVSDAKFHPINGNIIAAVNHEIWEIDPKDGHTIRVFEGGYPADVNDLIRTINITTDGQKIITGGAMGKKGILIWDYITGSVTKIISKTEIFDVYENIGIFPDNNRIIFNTYQNDYGSLSNKIYINIYNLQLDSIVNQTSMADTYCDRFILSKDGKYIAYCIGKGNPKDGWYNTMELWDAETLTKVKDFGSPGDINEFRDVQISDDNQYIGYTTRGGGPKLLLIKITEGKTNKFNEVHSFVFSPDSKKILISSSLIEELDFLNLSTLDTVYQYHKLGGDFCINKENEIFSVGFDYKMGSKMQFFSKKWYEVGINDPKEPQATISPNPASEYITLDIPPLEKRGLGGVLQEIRIFDIFGNEMHPPRQTSSDTPQERNLRIDISTLPAGMYFVRIGNEKPIKFIKL